MEKNIYKRPPKHFPGRELEKFCMHLSDILRGEGLLVMETGDYPDREHLPPVMVHLKGDPLRIELDMDATPQEVKKAVRGVCLEMSSRFSDAAVKLKERFDE